MGARGEPFHNVYLEQMITLYTVNILELSTILNKSNIYIYIYESLGKDYVSIPCNILILATFLSSLLFIKCF